MDSLHFIHVIGVMVISIMIVCLDAYERVDVKKRVNERRMSRHLTHGSYIRKRSIEIEEDEKINERDLLLLEPGENLRQTNSEPTCVGVDVKKYQETYKDIPVFDGIVTVETTKVGELTGDASGTLIQKISEDIDDVNPRLNKDEILERAIETEGDAGQQNVISDVKIELWIYPDEDNKARLVYFVQYLIEGNVTKRPSMILDSSSGELILKYDALETASLSHKRINTPPNALCNPNSIKGVGGNQKIGKIEYGSEPYCIQPKETCFLENSHVRVVNMMGSKNETESTQKTISFSCNEYPTDGGEGAYSPALDAFFHGTVIAKMYAEWVGGSLLENKIVLRVHYGRDLDNAFWNGENITLGDGKEMCHPFVSLDVIGHEIGHGVVERHSNLLYIHQSGGINEAFADILGETAVAYLFADEAKLDWKIGAEITKSKPFLRAFDNPESDGKSISHVGKYNLSMDVHFSSGIFRYAFYTLVTKQNVSIRSAFRAFDRANKLYWHHLSTFQEAGCLVIKAAYDLGQDVNAYEKAFDVVGINDCKLEGHIRSLVNNKEYNDIVVSNDSKPLFKFTAPLWVDNITVTAESEDADIGIYVSSTSAVDEPLASGENTVQFPYEGGATIYIKLATLDDVKRDVTLKVNYTCDPSWKPNVKVKSVTDIAQYITETCVFLFYCNRERYYKTKVCQ